MKLKKVTNAYPIINNMILLLVHHPGVSSIHSVASAARLDAEITDFKAEGYRRW